MGVLSNNYSQIVPGALISASYVSDIYDVLMGSEREDIMLSGSLSVTGSIYGNLIGTASNAVTASYVIDLNASTIGTASFSNFAETALSASHAVNSDTASYVEFNNVNNLTAFSSSINSRTVALENFSSSLDNIYATDAALNAATASLSQSIAFLSGSYLTDSSSFDTRILNLENFSSSIDTVFVNEIEFGTFTSSYYTDSSSFDTRILNNSSSINSLSSNFTSFTQTYNTGSFTGSFNGEFTGIASNAISSSYSDTASYVNTLNQNVLVSGSLTVVGGATIFGSSSFLYVTASQLAVSSSYISVNVFEPLQRFGGIYVFDSGSSNATASLTWDSLNDRWVYTNVSGAAYEGGMLLSGPRNYAGIGNEPSLTKWFIPRSDGTDHLDNSQIFSSGSITIITGSLTVTSGITASLQGTSSWASNAITASYIQNAQTASYVLNAVSSSFATTASLAQTASFINLAQTASFVTTAQTASYVLNAISSSFASTSSNTPNAIVTASVSSNTITFTKGDASTFPITVNTGSGTAIQILDEGVSLTAGVTSINFSGSLVTATNVGSAVTVRVPGLTTYSSSAAAAGAATGSTAGIIYPPSTITTPVAGTYLINVTTDVTNTGTTGQFIEISIYYGATEQTETLVRTTNVANQTARASLATHKILTVDGATNVSFGLRTGANANAWTINRFVLTMVKIV